MLETIKVCEMSNLIVRDVEYAKAGILVQTRDFCQSIVGNVKFFEIGKFRKAGYLRQAIRLY